MKNLYFLILVFTLFSNCSHKENIKSNLKKCIDENFTYFDNNEKPVDYSINNRDKILTCDEEKLINKTIENIIKENFSDTSKNPKQYGKQCIVRINEYGEKEVWVNCVFKEDFSISERKKSLIEVEDGGEYFFNFKINISNKKYYKLIINGLA